MATKSKIHTQESECKCKLCDAVIKFDTNDASTYLSKTKHEKFFGNQLFTYRVSHQYTDDVHHINTLLIDQKGLFRGYIDAYEEKVDRQLISTTEIPDFNEFLFLGQELDSKVDDNWFNFFTFYDLKEQWLVEIVKSKNLKLIQTLRFIYQKILESQKLYETLPTPLKVDIADMKVYLWIKDSKILAISAKNSKTQLLKDLNPLCEAILNYFTIHLELPRKRSFLILVDLLKIPSLELTDSSIQNILQILTNDLYYSSIKIKYPEKVDIIAKKIASRFSVEKDIILDLLLGKKTFIEILEQDEKYIKQFQEFLQIIDFINRRKLMNQLV